MLLGPLSLSLACTTFLYKMFHPSIRYLTFLGHLHSGTVSNWLDMLILDSISVKVINTELLFHKCTALFCFGLGFYVCFLKSVIHMLTKCFVVTSDLKTFPHSLPPYSNLCKNHNPHNTETVEWLQLVSVIFELEANIKNLQKVVRKLYTFTFLIEMGRNTALICVP